MTDLLHVLPDFPTHNYTHLLPSLERHRITTTDLLTLDALEIAKRARLPLLDLKSLTGHVLSALQNDLFPEESDPIDYNVAVHASRPANVQTTLRKTGRDLTAQRPTISTLDLDLDDVIGGGIPTGYITEIVGESGAGKTQVLLSLLLSAQLPSPLGLSRPTLYVSTEGTLATTRLAQILSSRPVLLAADVPPSLTNIYAIQTPDLESQDHILTYQVPILIERENIGLVVVDSVAANYRAERPDTTTGVALAERSGQLAKLGAQLRTLARVHDCAIVVANQVSDRFITEPRSTPTATSLATSSPYQLSSSLPHQHQKEHGFNPLSLDHQLRFFSGWGSNPASGVHSLKSPSLGLVWANQIAARVVLIKEACYRRDLCSQTGSGNGESADWSSQTWRRWMKVAFAAWAESTPDDRRGMEFEIWEGGLRAVGARTKTNVS